MLGQFELNAAIPPVGDRIFSGLDRLKFAEAGCG
jgi:hypothetical protein